MGKKCSLNKLISKWIRSDLPKDRSTVLLVGVTRIPTSPLPIRCYRQPPTSTTEINKEAKSLSRNPSFKGSRTSVRKSFSRISSEGKKLQVKITSLERTNNVGDVTACEVLCIDKTNTGEGAPTPTKPTEKVTGVSVLFSNSSISDDDCNNSIVCTSKQTMEQSVDSIGNCSLDVDAASEADLITDSAEASSLATLKSVSLLTPTTSEEPHHHHQHHHHLPSYLSLACTVNGYSTTTNYDPIRLSRSRDASPHRCGDDDLTASNKKPQPPPITYTVQNNLLSPPNLVPLPITNSRSSQLPQKSMNMENTLPEPCTGEFYSSKTITFLSTKESHCYNKTSSRFTRDTTDGTVVDKDNRHIIQSKCVSFESKNIISLNGQTKCVSETNMGKEITNGTETKSFIQQRVERLYGPGALAQGFFVSKRQKNKLSESDHPSTLNDSDEHSKSSTGDILESNSEPNLKQSNSSPTLPVMRHLRPEFRAQLPIVITPKKESFMQKNSTIPELKVDTTTIQPNTEKVSKLSKPTEAELNTSTKIDKDVKDGNYFLKILEDQTKRLLEQADDIESLIDAAELTEDINGKLRSAAGKARLLVSQKMQQFRGLCVNNINQSDGEAFPTTNEDLQGFWDMVMLQVDQVDALYREIQILKNNNWQEIAKSNDNGSTNGTSKNRKTVVNRNIKNQTSAVNEEARKQREARRKQMIEERRKAMRAQMKSKPDESSIEIYVPESS